MARFARQIAGQGYIVAAPSSYHDFVGPEPLAYDAADTDRGNQFKIQKVRIYSPPAPFAAAKQATWQKIESLTFTAWSSADPRVV